MYDNGRRLLADRWTCTFIGLNDVLRQTSFRQHGYRTPIGRLRLGVNARTELRTSVAWVKLNTN